MYKFFLVLGAFLSSMKLSTAFANKHVREVIAIAPRTEALETPINVTKVQDTYWNNESYMRTEIKTVDNA